MTSLPRSCLTCGRVFRPVAGESRCRIHRTGRRGSTRAWRKVRAEVLARDRRCYYCGGAATEVDHVIPVAKGGTDDRSNLVPACGPCNRAKGAQIAAKRGS